MVFLVVSVVWAEETSVTLKDHGVFGTLFEIAEEDMIEALKTKLQKLQHSGELVAIESALKDKAKAKLETPSPVQGLKPTQIDRTFIHDPTLVIEADIKDHEGHILAQRGQRLNPLNTHKPSQGLLFIDGENEAQKQWAKQHSDQFIIILVKGKPLEVEKDLGVPIYFDQGGVLCRHYHIQQIPARIEVNGETLKVTEFKVDA
jgi:conjugal transfer pilus assembly protein TraW